VKPDPIFPGERFDENALDMDAWRADQERIRVLEESAHSRLDRAVLRLSAPAVPYRSVLDVEGSPAPFCPVPLLDFTQHGRKCAIWNEGECDCPGEYVEDDDGCPVGEGVIPMAHPKPCPHATTSLGPVYEYCEDCGAVRVLPDLKPTDARWHWCEACSLNRPAAVRAEASR